jgi:hypothetical protein
MGGMREMEMSRDGGRGAGRSGRWRRAVQAGAGVEVGVEVEVGVGVEEGRNRESSLAVWNVSGRSSSRVERKEVLCSYMFPCVMVLIRRKQRCE